jgi:cytochrome c556
MEYPRLVNVAAAFVVLLASSALGACAPEPAAPESTAVGQEGWLAGTTDEKFETVATQLRGFDMAMVETGYRYEQLYWAAQDGNFGHADYQAGKIRTAIENGLERRPRRAESAQPFLNTALPSVQEAITQQDAELLRERVETLRVACNTCHEAEQVAFIPVGVPQTRLGGCPDRC